MQKEKLVRTTRLTLIGVALAIFMGAIENTVAGTAMPTVIGSLGGIEYYSWVFSAYILAATVMTPIWGKMADVLGRRPAFIGGLTCFIVGSALSGASHSMSQLIAFRVLQGLGAAALFPIGMTIASDLLTLEQRAKIIGLFSGMWGVASLVGPLVGGYLATYLSWRWVFYLSLPFGIAAGIIVWATYQEKYQRKKNIKVDYPGAIVLALALTLLLVCFEGTDISPVIFAATAAGAILLGVLFIYIELKSPDPLIPLDIFRNRIVSLASIHGFFAAMTLLGTLNFLPLFVQSVKGTDAITAGRILMPYVLPWVVAATMGGRLVLRIGYRRVVLAGMAFMILGAFFLSRLSPDNTILSMSFYVALLGIGGGFTMASLMIAAQHAVKGTQLGVTTSLVLFCRSIGAAVGVAVMGALMNWRLGRLIASGPPGVQARGHDLASTVLPQTRQGMSYEEINYLQSAFAGSLRLAFSAIFVASLLALVAAILLPSGSVEDLAYSERIDSVGMDGEARDSRNMGVSSHEIT